MDNAAAVTWASEFFSDSPGDSNIWLWLKMVSNHWFIASSDNYSLVRYHVEVAGTFRNSTDG